MHVQTCYFTQSGFSTFFLFHGGKEARGGEEGLQKSSWEITIDEALSKKRAFKSDCS